MSSIDFRLRIKAAAKASFLHLILSAMIALSIWWLVVRRWYPYPLDELAGGLSLLSLVFVVDIICGPLLTLIVFNPAKSKRELLSDFAVIVLVQLSALIYGVYSVAEARPVVVAFEKDRLVAVPAAGIDIVSLSKTSKKMRSLSWSGPMLIGTRIPKDATEQMNVLEMGLQGLEPSARPDWWQTYELSLPDVLAKMQPLSTLRASRSVEEQAKIDIGVKDTGLALTELHYLPMTGQKRSDYIALLNAEGHIVGYANVDGF